MAASSKTIAVGMSGGIDSTIAAYLLKKQGYNIIGITMKICDDSLPFSDSVRSGCYGPGEDKDIEDAQRAAEKIGIPHHVVDVADGYKKSVLKYFREEYLSGKTPNPCIVCNQKIKFGLLLDKVYESGIHFDFFATGHYARKEYSSCTQRHLLKRSLDSRKDQSYFLYRLSQEQLIKSLFPLGNYFKIQVRNMALEFGFKEYADKPESQDFYEGDDNRVFFPDGRIQPGDIVDRCGRILGHHEGIVHYTIGQRKGLNLGGLKEPLYVIKLDACKNQVIVGPQEDLLSVSLIAGELNWISIPTIETKIRAQAKIRLHHMGEFSSISPYGPDQVKVDFDEPQMSITPGQSIVFYDGDLIVGGGIIQSIFGEG